MTEVAAQLINQKFARLTVIEFAGTRRVGGRSERFWQCRCECGSEIEASGRNLRSGNTKSCGCLQRDVVRKRNFKNGLARRKRQHPLFNTWTVMLVRCRNTKRKYYGARGISVCARWYTGEGGLSGFECFLADMGDRQPGFTLDRIDVNGNYEPNNCRWAPHTVQVRNRRATKLNVDDVRSIRRGFLSGKTQKELSAQYRVSLSTISSVVVGKTWADVQDAPNPGDAGQ